MKKMNKYLGLGLLAGLLVMTSCEEDYINHKPANLKPMISNVGPTSFNLAEGETATIDIAISSPIALTGFVIFRPTSGDAALSDFQVGNGSKIDYSDGTDTYHTGGPEGYVMEIPPYSETLSIPVEAIFDILPEGNETVTFEMQPYNNRELLVENGGAVTYTLNITNSISDDLDITMSWDGTYTDADGDDQDLCDIDFDMELYDSSFTLIGTAYSGCPENFYIPAGALPDGDYYLLAQFYAMYGATFQSAMNFPVELTVTKIGQVQEVIDLSTMWNSTVGGFDEGNPDWFKMYVLNISGTTYTLTDADTSEILFQGKVANFLQNFKPKSK